MVWLRLEGTFSCAAARCNLQAPQAEALLVVCFHTISLHEKVAWLPGSCQLPLDAWFKKKLFSPFVGGLSTGWQSPHFFLLLISFSLLLFVLLFACSLILFRLSLLHCPSMFPIPSQVVARGALSLLCGSSLKVCCSLIPSWMALIPVADRVCWRQGLLGGFLRSCSYQLYHIHNSCEWQEGFPMLNWEGRRNITRTLASSDVAEVSDYFLHIEWFRKLWLISQFKNGLGCKSVFGEYESQKHNSDKFDSFQFLQLILTSK